MQSVLKQLMSLCIPDFFKKNIIIFKKKKKNSVTKFRIVLTLIIRVVFIC